MNIGKACAIFRNINNDKFTDDEKIEAIREVIDMETHNGIAKSDCFYALSWLLNKLHKEAKS